MAKYKRLEIPLVAAIRKRTRRERKAVFLLLAAGAVRAIRHDRGCIHTAERIIFNLDVLRHVKRVMRDKDLTNIIAYGMELADVAEYVADPLAMSKACDTIEKMIRDVPLPQLR